MSKSHDAQLAASHVLDLLVTGDATVEATIKVVAAEYELKPAVVEAWLSRSFPSAEALEEWRTQQRLALENRAIFQAEVANLEAEARSWAEGVRKACEPDGEPGWQYCCDRFLEARGVRSTDLRKRAREIFRDAGERFDAARARYVERHGSAKG